MWSYLPKIPIETKELRENSLPNPTIQTVRFRRNDNKSGNHGPPRSQKKAFGRKNYRILLLIPFDNVLTTQVYQHAFSISLAIRVLELHSLIDATLYTIR